MPYTFKSINLNDRSRYYTKMKHVFNCILLLALTNHCTVNTGEQVIREAIQMSIQQTILTGQSKTIPVEFTINNPALLKDYQLRVQIDKQPGANSSQSSISYKQQEKNKSFSTSQPVRLNQLIKNASTSGTYIVNFVLNPAKNATRVTVSFELLSPELKNPSTIKVTWHLGEMLVQVRTINDQTLIEVKSLSGDINNLDEWMIHIVPIHNASQVKFDIGQQSSPTVASLRDLLPGTTRLLQDKPYSIKISVPKANQESAFMVIPIKRSGLQAGAKPSLSPRELRFVASYYGNSAYANGAKNAIDEALGNPTQVEGTDPSYKQGQSIGSRIGQGLVESIEFLLGLATIGAGIGIIVLIPLPGIFIGPFLIALGFITVLDASLPSPRSEYDPY